MNKEEQLKIYSAYLPYGLHFYPSEKSDLFHDLYADNFPHTTQNYKTSLLEGDEDAIKISKSYLKQRSPFMAIEDDELFLGQFESSLGFNVDDVFASEVKPILYDLSYLTKEIEHGGEMFIPIEKIQEIFVLPEDKCYLLRDFVNSLSDFYFTKDLTDIFRFKTVIDIYNKLLEWHLNVFGLPEGQFINKATLTNK